MKITREEIIKLRETNEYIDLSFLDLRGLDLSGLDLTGTNFYYSVCDDVDFSNSKLYNANFNCASTRGAKNVITN